MQTKMDVYITVPARFSEISERLQPFEVKVTDLGTSVRVYAQIDIRNDAIEKILTICHEYGDCSVDAHMVTEGS